MKLVNKILTFLAVLVMLIVGVVFACVMNEGLAEKMGNLIAKIPFTSSSEDEGMNLVASSEEDLSSVIISDEDYVINPVKPLSDYALSEEDMISTLPDYYDACYRACMAQDKDVIWFQLLVPDKDMWLQIYNGYESSDYEKGYSDLMLIDKGGDKTCEIQVNSNMTEEGYYVITHTISLQDNSIGIEVNTQDNANSNEVNNE